MSELILALILVPVGFVLGFAGGLFRLWRQGRVHFITSKR